jgi:hypothetical protein
MTLRISDIIIFVDKSGLNGDKAVVEKIYDDGAIEVRTINDPEYPLICSPGNLALEKDVAWIVGANIKGEYCYYNTSPEMWTSDSYEAFIFFYPGAAKDTAKQLKAEVIACRKVSG